MKTLLNKTLFAIVILLCIFILGITSSIIVSTFITITTELRLQDCIISGPFVFFSIIGIIISAIYINEQIRKL